MSISLSNNEQPDISHNLYIQHLNADISHPSLGNLPLINPKHFLTNIRNQLSHVTTKANVLSAKDQDNCQILEIYEKG